MAFIKCQYTNDYLLTIVLTMRILLLYPKKMTLLNYLKMHIQFRNYIRCGMKRMKSDFREM